jgi:serine/threonine protein kinase
MAAVSPKARVNDNSYVRHPPDLGHNVSRFQMSLPSRLGPYEIRAKLGAGGMGEVYLAEDTRLKRQVAIKILAAGPVADEQGRRRLVREAQAAAALDHANICSIYDVSEQDGRTFIVMQHVQGDTLAARIHGNRPPLSEALDIACQVADGLAEAHARGIVHRDIKPQNIMITARGQVKILDFGLAKATADGAAESEVAETHSLLTEAGAIIGTAPYMSPEQVKGQALDARSDIFSFGAVLYELLSGHRAFGAGNFAEMISAVLTSDPPPLAAHGVAAPPGIERVIGQCLQKNREQRYQTMREVRLELESVRRALESGVIQSPAPDQPLSTNRSAQRAAPVGGSSKRVVLATIVGAIVVAAASYAALKKPFQGEAARSSQAINSPAYDLYLRGKVNVGSENRENNDAAIKLLTQAVAADPAFAPAHAQLARAYNIKAFYYAPDAEKKQLNEDAEVAIVKALSLDPELAEAHLARGLLLWTHGNRFPHESAVQSYKRAIALDASLDEAHHQLALVYLHVGLLDRAWGQIDHALAANPANMMARFATA